MSDPIRPALAPGEWRLVRSGERVWFSRYMLGLEDAEPDARYGAAAVLLHGHPQGFTHEDVKWVRAWADDLRDSARVNARPTGTSASLAVWADSLADRIAALLPPEDT